MRKVNEYSNLIIRATIFNVFMVAVAQAHPLAALHAHTGIGAVGIALSAIGCLCLLGFVIKRITRKTA